MKNVTLKRRLLECLGRGVDEARTAADLYHLCWETEAVAEDYDYDWHRKTRRAIRELTEEGHPILSSTRGFWLSANRGELARSVLDLRARAKKILERAGDLERIYTGSKV